VRIGKLGDRSWHPIVTIRGGRITTIPGIEISGPGEITIIDEDLLLNGDFNLERIIAVQAHQDKLREQLDWDSCADEMQGQLDIEGLFLTSTAYAPPKTPRVLSILSDCLPKHLEAYKDEIHEFVEDGIADRANSGISVKLFIFAEFCSQIACILKASFFVFRWTRRRNIESAMVHANGNTTDVSTTGTNAVDFLSSID